jgi:hypothetical protein
MSSRRQNTSEEAPPAGVTGDAERYEHCSATQPPEKNHRADTPAFPSPFCTSMSESRTPRSAVEGSDRFGASPLAPSARSRSVHRLCVVRFVEAIGYTAAVIRNRGKQPGRRLRLFRASANPLESHRKKLAEVEVPRGMHDFYANDHLSLAHVQDDIIRHSSVENILRARIETQIQEVCTFIAFDLHLSSPNRRRKHTR